MEDLQRLLPKAPGVGEIFQLLRTQPMTRAQLCATTGQARSTIAARLDSLLEVGLVEKHLERTPTMGRPASSFRFRPAAGTVLGIDVGARHIHVAVTDLATEILAEERLDITVDQGPEAVLGAVISSGRNLLTHGGVGGDLVGVGIGVPGPVNHLTGRPSSPPIMPGWDGYDIVGTLSQSFGAPIYVDNDANIMAMGEHALAWSDTPDLLFLKFGTGVGLGIILDGKIRRGAQGASGDIGHVRIPGGPPTPCHCGGVGCLEAVVGSRALAAMLRSRGTPAETGEDVVAQVRAGDVAALQIIRDAGRTAGDVIAGVVSLLNPSVIAVGGVFAQAHEQLIAGMRETVYAKSLPLATQNLQIVASKTGTRAGIIGAAALVCDQVLSSSAVDALADARTGSAG